MHAGVSEADSDQKGLVPLPSDGADAAAGNPASSSDEDTSDEAFAARHAVFEAEEQQRFNSFAGKPVVSASNTSDLAHMYCMMFIGSIAHMLQAPPVGRNLFYLGCRWAVDGLTKILQSQLLLLSIVKLICLAQTEEEWYLLFMHGTVKVATQKQLVPGCLAAVFVRCSEIYTPYSMYSMKHVQSMARPVIWTVLPF